MADIKGTKGNDKIIGSTLQDLITAGSGDDVIDGDDGNDTIYGGAHQDLIFGSAGDDFIDAGTGNDAIYGGGGNDIVFAGQGDDIVYAGQGNDTYHGGKGFDTVDFSLAESGVSIDAGKGSTFGDSTGSDAVRGFERIIGSAHDDFYRGSTGNDDFSGGAGFDVIRGGMGGDVLAGGADADLFVWRTSDILGDADRPAAVDTLTDLGSGDTLDLADILQGRKFTALDEVVRFTEVAGGTMLQVNIDGAFVDTALVTTAAFDPASVFIITSSEQLLA